MNTGRFAAVILAAGYSSRMQCFKPLLKIGAETITDRLINLFMNNGVEVFLVTGYRQDELTDGIKNHDIHIVPNPDYQKGMFSSVQAGLQAIGENFQGVFIIPVDIPLVSSFTIRKLLEAVPDNPGNILYPVFNNKRGHPPLITSRIAHWIANCPADMNLKAALSAFEETAVVVPVDDANILFDIDCPADYEELLKRAKNHEGSLESE